ncbi:MAG TPA: hypothetical protein VGM98_07090 [Schlesneria sp.]|jgi:hypothetical protein
MDQPIPQKGYSAEVRLELRAEGQVFDLAGIGPNKVTPRAPLELPVCIADVVMYIDGTGYLWPVRLPNGAVPFDKSVPTAPRGEMQRLGDAT